MKKLLTILTALTIVLTIQAESPQKISYQAIIRNTKGALVTNQNVGMKISIQKWVLAMPKPYYSTIYAETQTQATNENGLVSIAIGTGTPVEGSVLFKNIDWAAETLYLKTEIDPSGGSAYSITSTTQLLSVPYALHAKTAGSASIAESAKSITTSSGVYTPEYVVDIDGNAYKTIKIGDQVWMAENLKTTRYRNGDAISNQTMPIPWGTTTNGAWCDYKNLPLNGNKYGHLYNWYAVADPRNIAPEGWHVPTATEWIELRNYLIANGGNWDETQTDNKIAKSMAACTNWQNNSTIEGSVGNDILQNNSSGFNALPGGYRNFDSTFKYIGTYSMWWSSTASSTKDAYYSCLYVFKADLTIPSTQNIYGFSVRCVKD